MSKRQNKSTGSLGEKIASIFLQKKGFVIVRRNLEKPWGEIDIICEKGGIVHFVEVKSVSCSFEDVSRETHDPEELVDSRKIRKISSVATYYMQDKKDTREYQIDLIAVFIDRDRKKAQCRMIEQIP